MIRDAASAVIKFARNNWVNRLLMLVLALHVVSISQLFETRIIPQASLSSQQIPDLLLPPFVPAHNCTNVFLVLSDEAGIGHRMTAIVFAAAIALESNAAILLHESLFSAPRGQDSATYPFMRKLFNLEAFMIAEEIGMFDNIGRLDGVRIAPTAQLGSLTFVSTESVQDAQLHSQMACDQLITLPTGHTGCRDASGALNWCMQVGEIGRAHV